MIDVEELIGVADAKRRFSELLDRVDRGERIVIARRGRPAVALVPPGQDLDRDRRSAPAGFAVLAGALADWDELDDAIAAIEGARRGARDRPVPVLD